MVEAFLWGLLGASSLVLGALVVAVWRPHERVLGMVMAFGAGVLLSAVAYELVEEAVDTSGGTGGTTLGFFTGAVVFTAGDYAVSSLGYRNRKDIGGAPPKAGPTAIVLGALLDGVPESAVLGLTLVQTGEVGVAMLVAVFVSNMPESIAASVGLRNGGWSQTAVLGMWAGIALLSATAAGAGYAFLDGAAPRTIAFILAFAGGAVLSMLSTSMIPEGYEHAGRSAGLFTVLGFAVAFAIHWAEA
jgi:ZIP family zinc transporter